jgi:hypothetical protein
MRIDHVDVGHKEFLYMEAGSRIDGRNVVAVHY